MAPFRELFEEVLARSTEDVQSVEQHPHIGGLVPEPVQLHTAQRALGEPEHDVPLGSVVREHDLPRLLVARNGPEKTPLRHRCARVLDRHAEPETPCADVRHEFQFHVHSLGHASPALRPAGRSCRLPVAAKTLALAQLQMRMFEHQAM
ncbi:hypothetical protein ACIQB5_35870 [Streptomyces sp. NPDC088560]|uniref:hypothetical protein n=1 Tax=Streptomyces sp. NPDC088560 TaxID=3365868 RepID=UPI003814238C